MLNEYFGPYLLNKGLLTPNQLYNALQHGRSTRAKLGVLAVNAGLMTADQVEKVHGLQRTRDQRFGTLAVEQGYLTDDQVDQLLRFQGEAYLALIQAITDQNYLTLAAVGKALADFRAEYGIEDETAGTEEAIIRKLVNLSMAGDKADLLCRYVGLTLRNIVRLLDDTPFILPAPFEHDQPDQWTVAQQTTGDVALSIRLIMNDDVLLAIASRLNEEKLAVIDELALDSVGEFLNVNNGIFCSTLSNVGFTVNLQPQTVRGGGKTAGLPNYLRVAIGTSFGRFDLVLSFRDI
jgi:hypothetical protein